MSALTITWLLAFYTELVSFVSCCLVLKEMQNKANGLKHQARIFSCLKSMPICYTRYAFGDVMGGTI